MKVVKLRTENFLRLTAVEITPSGEVVKVSGKNGEGKTSTIDSIWAALCLSRLNLDQPVHKGAKKATIKLDLGEIKVERTITEKGNELKVTAADGVKVATPQRFLDSLIGELSFDPGAFERMKQQDQFEQLRHLVKVDIDFADIARKNQADFDRRTEINRQAKVKRAQLDAAPLLGLNDLTPVDEAPLLEKINKAGEHNAQLEKRRAKRAEVQRAADDASKEAARIEAEINGLRSKIVTLEAERELQLATAKAELDRLSGAAPLPAPIDVSAVTAELVKAQEQNARLVQIRRRSELEAEAVDMEAQAAQLTDAIDARNAAKEAALSAARMPVLGLSLGDGVVLYQGLPFSQASAAERLRVSMAIAMAANPKIRVIRIADGSLLDSRSMAIVGELARENDYQVWVEVVDETKKVGIVIEDGAVVAVNQ